MDYVFANAQYDLGWLRSLGVEIKGRINDVCIADTLIDEERPDGYSLEALAQRWLGQGKDEALLREACQNWSLDNVKADLWKLPASLVGAYGESDPVQTLAIWQKQKPVLRSEGLWPVYEIERELTPILFNMFWQGIRVDASYAEQLNARWLIREKELLRSLDGLDIWSGADIAKLCDKEGIRYSRTAATKNFPNGQPSITKGFMESTQHPALRQVQEVRAINRVRSVYLEENLIRNVHHGRIHPQYIQMASDDGGTRTMRLACRNPNAQQFPKRSTLFDAKALRKALIPEEGTTWAKFDYWSQEPVIQCHYALALDMPGAKEVKAQFEQGIKLYTFIEKATKGVCNYDQSKEVVLARSYGMGKDKMSSRMGISADECDQILRSFDDAVPYINLLASSVAKKAQLAGFIKTLIGHKRHFNLFLPITPRGQKRNPTLTALPFAEAQAKWPGDELERAWTYKAFNALIQGGAAGQTKKALVEINRTVGLPQMTVHDEISKSIHSEKETKLMNEIMINCVPLLAPVRADLTVGTTWS